MVALTPGDHTINWSLDGLEILEAVITVHTTGAVACKSSINGVCNTSTPPGIYASGSEVVGYLEESVITPTGVVTFDMLTYTPGETVTINWSDFNETSGIITLMRPDGTYAIPSLNITTESGSTTYILPLDAVEGTWTMTLVGDVSGLTHDTKTVSITIEPLPFDIWLDDIGGPAGIENNLSLFIDLINEYYGINPTPVLDFTLTLSNFINIINYYYGIG